MKTFSPRLRHLINTRYADRVEKAWVEQDDYFRDGGWSYWIALKTGYRNVWVDPVAPLHLIHEANADECIQQLSKAAPCHCEVCQEEAARAA